ncbi:putative LPS assembly protein LptD [Chryseobacterium sp. PTM-20240506]|uniref:putative LPS assembly protein LptD n=1 Tax=unclassified Chryseobacterium TaxID=2593645 RepID=UPI0015555F07|nr:MULTISPECIES: putative LPS assembly protein LptD [unclassified Chryseobacterium]MDC8106386.1 LPS-assembly protein LptD [Chryseobacterium sp. B21-037]MDQ1804889.1 putative LPS assembly protein LptD [Chryseobacterium sp. CKR4-1]WBV55605.1 putative LPS assembly protein LptD [Chryseobacterium daecheongense]
MAKTVLKNILQILIILIFNNFLAQKTPEKLPKNTVINDTISKKDTIVAKKESLDDVLMTKADNIRRDFPKKMIYLNQKAQVKYQDMQIDADYISIDEQKNLIYARGKQDSLGKKIIEPVLTTQAGKKYETDQFNYNYKTRQAIAYNARTEESEGVIIANKTKKYNDSVFAMRHALYTTDEYFLKKKDTAADYHLLASNIKLVKTKEKSQIITGPIQMYIEQVPTPLIMPFAILPFSSKRSAGILIPSFGERQDVGFFLNGIGYYQPIGDHFDMKVLADIYTKGSWNVRPEMNYVKKYRYSGNFTADIGTTIRGIKGLDDYSRSSTYRIAWRHTQDTKANPFLTFSASVDIVSNKFYNNTINNNYIFNQNVLNTQQNSTVTVTKRFLKLPATVTATASYSQNFATGLADLRLPQMNVAINQFYLFKSKTGVRQGLLENITVNTGLNLTNFVTTNEGELFTKAMWDKLQTGLTNNITLGTNTTVAKYFTFSLGTTINNALTTKTLTRYYDPLSNNSNKVVDQVNKQIAGYSYFSSTASLQTTLYGMLNFKKGSAIEAIRHMMTPSIGFTYSPDFGKPGFGYYKNYYDANGALTPYSIFDGGIVGSPTSGMQGSLGFNIGNNIEMKVKSKKDSTGVKKIKIFESLNLSGSYNFAAKDHPWSIFSINGQSSFFENKLSVNTSLSLDPYKILFVPGSDTGIRTERFGGFSVQGFNIQVSYPLSSEIFGAKTDYAKKYQSKGEIRNENYYFDDDHYAHFDQAWTLNVNANYAYSKNLSRFGTKIASVGLDGSIKLTPYWNINGSTHYDMITKQLAYTRIGFSRDQRSFTINFNWVPFGQYKVYDFFIGIKANILSDALKYKDRSFTQPNAPF